MGDRDRKVVELRSGQTGGSGPEEPEKPSRLPWKMSWLLLALHAILLIVMLFVSLWMVMGRLNSFDEAHVLVGTQSFKALSNQAAAAEVWNMERGFVFGALGSAVRENEALKLQVQALQERPGFGDGYVDGRREALDQVARHLGLGSEFFSQLLWTTETCHGDSDLVWMRGQLAEIGSAFGCSLDCSGLVNVTVKDASLEQVLGFFSRELDTPVINEAGVTGTVTIRLREIPPALALQAVAGQVGADLRFEDGMYRLVPFDFGTE